MTDTPLQKTLVALLRAGVPPSVSPSVSPDASTDASVPPELSSQAWHEILPLARAHGVTGLLYRAVQTLHRADAPESVLASLHETYLRSQLNQLLAFTELAALAAAFADVGIALIVLKGAALAPTLYSDPAFRPFGDLDLLIRPADYSRATALLLARGYRVVVEMNEGSDSELWGQQTFVRSGNHPSRVELHKHLFVLPYYRNRARLDWFWQHRAACTIEDQTAYMFDPAAQLLHLTAHAALHHRDTRLIWLYDIALLIARYGDVVDWQQLGDTAHSFGLARALQYALRETFKVWDICLPPVALTLLSTPNTDRYGQLMFTLARSRHREARWIADGLGSGAKYWLAHLVPSPAYMRERYRISNSALLPFYYIGRLGAGGVKFARALVVLVAERGKPQVSLK